MSQVYVSFCDISPKLVEGHTEYISLVAAQGIVLLDNNLKCLHSVDAWDGERITAYLLEVLQRHVNFGEQFEIPLPTAQVLHLWSTEDCLGDAILFAGLDCLGKFIESLNFNIWL